MAAVLDFESITNGYRGLFSTGRGVRALDGFLLRGKQERFRIFGSERRGEEYSPYSSRVGFSGARCCGELNMK